MPHTPRFLASFGVTGEKEILLGKFLNTNPESVSMVHSKNMVETIGRFMPL